MADEDTETGGNNQNAAKTVLDQARAALNKGAKEAVVNKLKDVLKRRSEAQRTVALCDEEAAKIVDDFNKGLL